MQKLIVLYDACVLYPAPLRDLLMHLAMASIYQAKWTNEIHDEWIRNVLANRPDLKPTQLERTRNLMNSHVQDCLVFGYERLINSLKLPDPNDRHVLAAAIHAKCSMILTYNLKDFPAQILNKYNIVAIHPDPFLNELIELYPKAVCTAIKQLRGYLKNPPVSLQEYFLILKQQSLHRTVERLNELSDLL